MTAEKITVSIPSETLVLARRRVRGGNASSLSAYIASAVEEKVKAESLRAVLDEILAETGGALTARETRKAEKVLGLSPKRRSR